MNLHKGKRIAVIGGGPAGLMAAETAANAGLQVDVYERMGSVGRKFLIAGKGGLNLTHSEPFNAFVARFGSRQAEITRWLESFGADALRDWATGLGVQTFVGSSGRVFPSDLKAAPLLRSWVRRLRASGVRFHVHHRWLGWTPTGALRFGTEAGDAEVEADAIVLALGGGSWSILGSDGSWQAILDSRGIDVAPLQPANCGFDVNWSLVLSERHAGAPIKPVSIHWKSASGEELHRQGEFVLTRNGIEGSLIYALSSRLRDEISAHGTTTIHLDLLPGRELARLTRDISSPRGKHSMAKHLHRHAGIDGAKAARLFADCKLRQRKDRRARCQPVARRRSHFVLYAGEAFRADVFRHIAVNASWLKPLPQMPAAQITVSGADLESPLRAIGQQSTQFRIAQIAPLAELERTELDVDDAHPTQLLDPIAKRIGHQADLPVESLGQHNAKAEARDTLGSARLGQLSMHAHATRHATEELIGYRLVDADQVFLLVMVFRSQQFVDDVAIAGQQDQTLGILVEPTNRKDALLMVDEVDDVALHLAFGCAGDANRLVQRDIDMLAHTRRNRPGPNPLALDHHLVAFGILVADPRNLPIQHDLARCNQTIRLTSRAMTGVADVFVQAHGCGSIGKSEPRIVGPSRRHIREEEDCSPLPKSVRSL